MRVVVIRRTDIINSIRAGLSGKYPSLCPVKKWAAYPYRENSIILENSHCQISVSEYCGIGAVSVFVNPATDNENLAADWIAKNFPGIKKIILTYVTGFVKLGTFSNGEAVFRRVENDDGIHTSKGEILEGM